MSTAFQTQGFEAKVDIFGVAFVASKITITETVDEFVVTSFESSLSRFAEAVNEERIPSVRRAEISIEKATFDTTANPYVAPQSLEAGSRNVPITYYKTGRAGGLNWVFPFTVVLSITDMADVAAGQPITLTAKSDGAYKRPGEP